MRRAAKPPKPELRNIPLDLIDEPPRPVRDTMDEVKLAELAESIAELGVIEPIVVEAIGGRYRIEAGHRRYCASIMAKLSEIPAVVHAEGTLKREAVKLHENLYREELNAAEEGMFYVQLLETECAGDVDKLCEMVKQKRSYVENRILIVQGDEQVLDALKRGKINFSVARELNLVKDVPNRRMLLDNAQKGGATALMVRNWRADIERIVQVEPPAQGNGDNQFTDRPPVMHTMRCMCCDRDDEPWDMELVYVHKRCNLLFLAAYLTELRRRIHGEAAEPVAAG